MSARAAIAFAAVLTGGCRSVPERSVDEPTLKQAMVNGTTIRYVEQGRGAPVVFVHGAISDHRTWDQQREAVAKRYRFIALDRRYFGTAPWPDTGVQLSPATDADDLAAFIRALEIEPAFLVGTSGGGQVVLITAVRHPAVVRAAFVNEPGLRSIVTDSADRRIVSEADQGRAAAVAAAQAGNMTEAARLLVDHNSGKHGTFDQLSAFRAMFVDNARTLLLSASPDVPITCEELGRIRIPVTVTKGQLTKPNFRVLADAAHRCVPQSQLVVIPNARHGAPRENPSAFNEALLAFLARLTRPPGVAAAR